MQADLRGKVAIVTGAAQGIGKAIAAALARSGATVVISDVQVDAGEAAAAEIGGQAVFVPCDITDVGRVEALIGGVVERFGRLDIMVNNAGVNASREERATTDRFPLETWQRIIDVDLNGTFYCCRAAASQMVKQKSGTIINISSVAGVVALRLQVAFVAAKAAVIKMTEAMACELGPLGIRVNTVSPGSTLTEGTRALFYADQETAERLLSFIPQRRPGTVEDIAEAVVFLASDAASYVNGHNLVVDGGWTSGFNRDF
jgi:NAD(P)-dependent dehydrogenase (short-subunit alcohol dehydrogenase family)